MISTETQENKKPKQLPHIKQSPSLLSKCSSTILRHKSDPD